jgi:hypothetical protein
VASPNLKEVTMETRAIDRRVLLLGAALLVALAALWLGVSAVRGAGSPAPLMPATDIGGGEFFGISSNGQTSGHGDCPFSDGAAVTSADI